VPRSPSTPLTLHGASSFLDVVKRSILCIPVLTAAVHSEPRSHRLPPGGSASTRVITEIPQRSAGVCCSSRSPVTRREARPDDRSCRDRPAELHADEAEPRHLRHRVGRDDRARGRRRRHLDGGRRTAAADARQSQLGVGRRAGALADDRADPRGTNVRSRCDQGPFQSGDNLQRSKRSSIPAPASSWACSGTPRSSRTVPSTRPSCAP